MLARKIISILLSIQLFNFQGVLASSPDPDQEYVSLSHLTRSGILSDWVSILEESSKPSNNQLYILIVRDLHGDFEAQMNVSKMMGVVSDRLSRKPLVLVEGASGRVDTSFFATFPDQKIRKTVTKEYVSEGWVTGPEYFSIIQPEKMQGSEIWGVEDRNLYIQNFKTFRQVRSNSEEMQQWFLNIEGIIQKLKENIYHSELLEWDKKISDRITGKLDLEIYLSDLYKIIDVAPFPNLHHFKIFLEKKNNFDFKRLESEKNKLIQELGNLLSKDDLSQLIQKSLEYRLGKMQTVSYLEYLVLQADKAGKNTTEEYPAFVDAIEIFKMQNEIDISILLKEIELCEEQILSSLLKTSEEKALNGLCEEIGLLKKISILQLTRKDWVKIQKSIADDPLGRILRSISELSKPLSIEMPKSVTIGSISLKDQLEKAKKFYEIALNRDQTIAENAIQRMNQMGAREAILITGGFHTDGIREILISKGIQCQIATPRLTHIPSDDVYLSRMLDERFEYHALALPSLFSLLIKSISPLLQVKEWERLATAYIRAWIESVFQAGGIQDSRTSRDALRRGLKSWESARIIEQGRLNEDEEKIMGLVERQLGQADVLKAPELTREEIGQFIRMDPVQAEVVLRLLVKFYPERKEDIKFAKSLYRKLYQPRIFSIIDRKSMVRAVSLPKNYEERIDRSADALFPYTEILTAVNILLMHENTSGIKKLVFRFDADRDYVSTEEDVMFINFKNPEQLKTIDVLKIYQRDLGWDFVPAIRKIESKYPYLLFNGGDFEAFNVVIPKRMAGMGDLVFIANAAQVLKEAFPGKTVRAIFGTADDYNRTALTRLIDGMNPELDRQNVGGLEVVLLSRNEGIIGRNDAAVVYALGETEKDVFNQQGVIQGFGGDAKAKVLVHEFGFECLIQDPLESGSGHLGFFQDEIGMAPVSPFSRDLYAQKYPRDDEKVRAQRKRILRKIPGWEKLNEILGQQDLERTIASEWGFVYAHEGYSIGSYFEMFEEARRRDEKFANGDKTFFVMCGRNDKQVQERVAQWAQSHDYNFLVYNSDTQTLTLARESKGSRVTVILDYSVPRKLFSELFLYSDDLPTLVTGQDNLANILYLNILSSGRPFFFEQMIFQDITSIYLYVQEKLGDEAVSRFKNLWSLSRDKKEEASRMFSAPREFRKFFRKIALALNEHNSFVPQIYYLVLRMINKRNSLEAGKRAEALIKELRKTEASQEIRRDGYVRNGDKSWEQFKRQRQAIKEYDITGNYQERLIRQLEGMIEDSRIGPELKTGLQEQLIKIKDPRFKVFGYSSIVKGKEDYLLDYYDQTANELYLSTDVIDELKERGPPSLVEEYLAHSILCPVFGHKQAIKIQQILFSDHYPNKKRLSGQTEDNLYKGILGKEFRNLIDWKVSFTRLETIEVLFNRILERYDLRDDVTLREVIMRLGDRYQLTERPSWGETVRQSVFLEDKFSEAQNRLVDQWMRLTPDDVAHHQIRTAVLSNLMLEQYVETNGEGDERDFVLLSLGSLLQDVSKGIEPIKSLTEKGRFLSRDERAIIHDHGHQSILVLDQSNAWEKMRATGLIQNQEEEDLLKLLVLYHADLPGFKKIESQLSPQLRDRAWLLLGFLKIADSVDAANDRSRPYNMHRAVRTMDVLYAEEKESKYLGLQPIDERVSPDSRALDAFHQIVLSAGERLRKMEELATGTEIYHELYKRLQRQSGIKEETPTTWVESHVPVMADKRIVEVTMEMALSDEMLKRLRAEGLSDDEMRAVAMSTSTGGIGPLLKERVIAQSNFGANVVGFSLLYNNVWAQKVQADGTLIQEKVEVGKFMRKVLEYEGEITVKMYDGREVKVKVWKTPRGAYGKGTVYFFDIPEMTDVVYPGSKDAPEGKDPFSYKEDARRDQSWILGRGALAWMKKINQKIDLVVMSEAPTIFAHHRVFKDEYTVDPFFADTRYVFNDHTPLEYAHPYWNRDLLRLTNVDSRYYETMPIWTAGGQTVDVTGMIMNAADGVYGVAEKHGRVMREMPMLRQFGDKITYVTNGVSAQYWPTDEFKSPGQIAKMKDSDLLAVKNRRRERLIRWLAKRKGLGDEWAEKMIREGNPVGIWTRRIVEYKRLDRFASILENDSMKEEFLKTGIVFVVGGRIHQDDDYGLKQYKKIQTVLAKDPRLKERVIFLENYNIWEAPVLFQGADFSLMLADDTREASATGFQKAQMNGDLIIASNDGAIPESVTFYDGRNTETANGFEVPFVGGKPTPEGLLSGFISFGNVFKDKQILGRMVRNTLNQSGRVSVDRTAKDMLRLFSGYFSAFGLEKQMRQEEIVKADQMIMRMNFSPQTARATLDRLNRTLKIPFVWKYKEGGINETNLFVSIPHLQGLIDGYDYIRSLGTVGKWSFDFHAYNQNGQGDILTYIKEATSVLPDTNPIRQEILRLVEQANASTSISEKAAINSLGIFFMDRVIALLRDMAGNLISDGKASPGSGVSDGMPETVTGGGVGMVAETTSMEQGAAGQSLQVGEALVSAIPSDVNLGKESISYVGYGPMIPKHQFAPPGNSANENLIDLWYETLKELAPDQPVLIHPRGSLTYLRSPDRIHWEIASDADFILHLPQEVIKQSGFYEKLEEILQRKAREMGITIEMPSKEEGKGIRTEYYNQRKLNMISRNGFKIPGHFVIVPFEMMDKALIVSGGFNVEGSYYGNIRGEELIQQVGVQWSRITRIEEDFRSLIRGMKIQLKEIGGRRIEEGEEDKFAVKAQKLYKRLILMAYILGDEQLHTRLLENFQEHDRRGDFRKREMIDEIARELKYYEDLSEPEIKKAILIHYRFIGYNSKFDELAREMIEQTEKYDDFNKMFWIIRHSSFAAQLILERQYGPPPWWVRGNQPKASEEMGDVYKDRETLREIYLVNTWVHQAMAGQVPEWMAFGYKIRRGLKGIQDEGDSSVENEINKLKGTINRYTSDPALRAKVERVLNLLAVHPHANRLSALQFEGIGYRLMSLIAENDRAYEDHKEQMDQKVKELYPEIRKKIFSAGDRKEALRMAMIYAGVMNLLDLTHAKELQDIATQIGLTINFEKAEVSTGELKTLIDAVVDRVKTGNLILDDLNEFLSFLDQKQGGMILYFLDNHGEVILDQLVIEQLLASGYNVVAVGRATAVQDDVTVDEARKIFKTNPDLKKYWDQNRLVVVTDGSYLLGADLRESSQHPDFLSAWKESVAYIAKGGGNFQSLYGQRLSIPGFHIRMMKNSPQAYHALKEAGKPLKVERSPFDMIMAFQSADPLFAKQDVKKQSEYHPVVQRIIRGEYTGKAALVMLKDKMEELSLKDKQRVFAYYLAVPGEVDEKYLFQEQYQFEDIAGIGLQGIVFQVRDIKTQQMMAIKVSYGNAESENDQLKHLLSYQKKTESHSNTLSIQKVGVVVSGDGYKHSYLVSEFLSIRELIDQAPKSNLTDYPYTSGAHIRSAVQVLDGLLYLMRGGILLRDPQLALTGDEKNLRTVLIDLGVMDRVENLKDLVEKSILRLRLRSFQGSWIRTILLLMEIALAKSETDEKKIPDEQLNSIKIQLDQMVMGMSLEEKRILNPMIQIVNAAIYFLKGDYEEAYGEIKALESDPSFDGKKLNAFVSYRAMRDRIINEKEVPEQLAREIVDRLKKESMTDLSPAQFIQKIGDQIKAVSEDLYRNERIRGKVILNVLQEIPAPAVKGEGVRSEAFSRVADILRQEGIPQTVIDVLDKIHGSSVFFMVLDRLAREFKLYQNEPVRELFLEIYIKEYLYTNLSEKEKVTLEGKISPEERERYQGVFNKPLEINDVVYQYVRERLHGMNEGRLKEVFGHRLNELIDGWEEPFWKDNYDILFLEPWTDESVSRIGQIAIALRNGASLNPIENEIALENELILLILKPVKGEEAPSEDSLRVVDRAA